VSAGEFELAVEPGAPPGSVDDVADDDFRPPEPPEPLLAELPEWEVRTVGFMLGLVFFGLHLTLGRDGPEDAFLPTPAQRREMAEPGAAMLNRSTRLRRLAPAGDGIAFFGLVGEFVLSEQQRVIAHRDGLSVERGPTVEEEIAHFGIRSTPSANGEASPSATVRPWRPPTIEPEPL
jgi:hypothetical protein